MGKFILVCCSLICSLFLHWEIIAQCPSFSNFQIQIPSPPHCEEVQFVINHDAADVVAGNSIDWYIGEANFNPYDGDGVLIASNVIISDNTVPELIITIPSDFCEVFGSGDWELIGILDPPPVDPCPEVFTIPLTINESCAVVSISGDGIVCAGNCPDNPNLIDFILTGDDLPVLLDLVFTTSILPPFPIDDIEIGQGQSLSICLEGVLPSFNPGTNTLTVPEFAIGFSGTLQITGGTTASGCPVSIENDLIGITFIAAPTVNAGDDLTICAGESVPVSGAIGGSATSSEWISNGDGVFENPGVLNTIYHPGADDIFNGSVTLILSAEDPDGACVPTVSEISITILPSVEVQLVAPNEICDNDIAGIMAIVSDPNVLMVWETSGDGSFSSTSDPETIYAPGPADILAGTVVITYQPVDPDQCIGVIPQITLTIVPGPDIEVNNPVELCAGEIAIITLDISGNYTSVQWDTNGDGDMMIISETEVHYQPGQIDIANQFVSIVATIQSSFPACGQITHIIPINISECGCPPILTMPPVNPLCADSDQLDLNSLIVDAAPGSWSITSQPPGNPASIINDVFTTFLSGVGNYVVTYSLTTPEPGCPSTSNQTIIVIDSIQFLADLGPDIESCGRTSVLLQANFENLTPADFVWASTGSGQLIPDVNDPLHLASYQPSIADIENGSVQISYTSISVCGNVSDTIVINFLNSPEAHFTFDTVTICNQPEYGSVWNALNILEPNNLPGILTMSPSIPVDLSDLSSIDFTGINEGYYTFYFTTDGATPPCENFTDSIVISVEECVCPFLSLSAPPPICQTFSMLPLTPFVMAGAPGSWQIVSSPPGGNPGIIVGDSFVPNGGDVGNYVVQFSFNTAPAPGCPDSLTTVIQVEQATTVELLGPDASCGQDAIFVSGIVSGSGSQVMWEATGLGSFNTISDTQTEYLPAITDVASAGVSIIGIVEDPNNICPDHRDTFQIHLVTPPSTSFSKFSDTICTEPDSIHGINFSQLIVEGDGTGFWTDIDGTGANFSDPTWVDFSQTPVGVYSITYTTQTAVAPCMDSVYTFELTVRACTCPTIIIDETPIVICADSLFDLSTISIDVPPGSWSVTNGPGGIEIDGGFLIVADAVSGTHELTYTIEDVVENCPSTASLFVGVLPRPEWTLISAECNGDKTLYEIVLATDDILLSVNTGVIDASIPGQIRLHSIPAGQDVTGELMSDEGCSAIFSIPAIDCNCTLLTEDIADTITFCPGDTFVLIPFVTGAQGLPFSTWITPDGQTMWPSLPLTKEGSYIWIVRDEANCERRDTFFVKFEGPSEIVFTTVDPSCAGLSDGSININELPGGEFPFSISINGNAFQPVSLPFTLDNISAQPITLQLRDNNQCVIDTIVELNALQSGSLDLGPNQLVPLGDSTLIAATVSGFEPLIWMWSPLMPGNVSEFWVTPSEDLQIHLTVIDENGCELVDSVWLRLLIQSNIFVPNVFTPNGDGINDLFNIVTSNDQTVITSLDIFDRWGNQVHSQSDATVYSWDGTFRNVEVEPGVYTYRISYTGSLGQSKVQYGDVTLVR